MIRETVSKKIRYYLQGLQDFPVDASKLYDFPALAPLRAAISVQQLLGVIAVAQNAATAATLKRIEGGKTDAISYRRLDGIELDSQPSKPMSNWCSRRHGISQLAA